VRCVPSALHVLSTSPKQVAVDASHAVGTQAPSMHTSLPHDERVSACPSAEQMTRTFPSQRELDGEQTSARHRPARHEQNRPAGQSAMQSSVVSSSPLAEQATDTEPAHVASDGVQT
jgi:hypothetical protein